VTRLMTFGAFVEIAPGKEGLVHISKMAWDRVDRVEDVLAVGDEVKVVVSEIDDQGRLNLSMRDLMDKPEGYAEQGDEEGRGGRGGRSVRGGRGLRGSRERGDGRDRGDRRRDRHTDDGERGGREGRRSGGFRSSESEHERGSRRGEPRSERHF